MFFIKSIKNAFQYLSWSNRTERLLMEKAFFKTADEISQSIAQARQQLELGQETLLVKCLRQYETLESPPGPITIPAPPCPPPACPPCLSCNAFWKDCRTACNETSSQWLEKLDVMENQLRNAQNNTLGELRSRLDVLAAELNASETRHLLEAKAPNEQIGRAHV